MAREKTKTDPIGVRFDKDLLEGLNLAGIANSPQKVLNLYERSYIELVDLKTKNIADAAGIKEINKPECIDHPGVSNEPKKLSIKERIELEKANLKTKK